MIALVGLLALAANSSARAQNATWSATPGSGNFNTGANWSPAAVPTGVAFFGTSNLTGLSFSTNTTIGGWTFNPGASNYAFTIAYPRYVIFTGAGITINGGAAKIDNESYLFFENASSAGSASIYNDGLLAFSDNSTAANANIDNVNTMTFSDASTAGAATITNAYKFTFNGSSTAGSANIVNTNTGGLGFYDSSSAGNSTITSNYLLDFYNTSTAGNATITNNNLMSFNDASTAGAANITNDNYLSFNNNSTAANSTIVNQNGGWTNFYGESNGGQAQLIANAGGGVDFSATKGPNGNGAVTAGSIAGAGDFYLGANTLVVGGNNLSTTVSGVISDCGPTGAECNASPASFGSLTKVGSGALTLTGANTYSGATTIDGGTLAVDGSIVSSSVVVNSGAVLTGDGLVGPGAVTVNSGAVFAPGSAGVPGTSMTIFGNLALNAGATYEVYLNPSTSTLAKVMGAASLDGEVLANFAPGAYVAKKYTILTATGGLGGTTFSSLAEINLPAGFAETLTYDADDVYLDLTSTLGATPGLNVNQRNVAAALGNAFNNGASLPPAFANVFGLSGAALPNALTQLSGEAATGARQGAFLFTDMFLSLLLDPYVENRGGGIWPTGAPDCSTGDQASSSAQALPTKKASSPTQPCWGPYWTVWGAGFGGGEQTSGNAAIGSHDASMGVGGGVVGADYHISPDAMAGFAIAGGATSWSLSGGLGGGNSSVFEAGIYGLDEFGPAYVAGALSFGNYWATTNRTVTLPGGGAYSANFTAQGFGGRVETGYHVALDWVTLTPYAAVQAQSFEAPSYAESAAAGGPGFALNYASQSATDARFELGAWADKTFAASDGTALKLFGRVAWAHDWQSNPALTATFQSLPAASFVVNGARPAADQALVTAGAEWRFAKNWTLMAKFEGAFGAGFESYGATGRLTYAW